MADEGLFAGQIEPARGRSGSDDERARVDRLFAEVEGEGAFAEIDGREVRHFELGAEADGLLLHVFDELRTLDSFGPTRKVLDQRGDGELTAGLMSFEDEGLQVGAGSVDGSGQAGASGAEDDSVACRVFRHMDPSSVNARPTKKMQEGNCRGDLVKESENGKSYIGLWNEAVTGGRGRGSGRCAGDVEER